MKTVQKVGLLMVLAGMMLLFIAGFVTCAIVVL